MTILRNAKHESYAQFVAKGEIETKAAELAGYSAKSAALQCWRLRKNEAVRNRIAELRSIIAERVVQETAYELTQAMRETDEALALAREKKDPKGFVAAVALRAKINGLLVEDRRNARQPLATLTDQQLAQLIGAVDAGLPQAALALFGGPAESPEAGPTVQ